MGTYCAEIFSLCLRFVFLNSWKIYSEGLVIYVPLSVPFDNVLMGNILIAFAQKMSHLLKNNSLKDESIARSRFPLRRCPLPCRSSVTKCRIIKLPNFSLICLNGFDFEKPCFSDSPKSHQIFWVLSWENLCTRIFKSCPIWSHCLSRMTTQWRNDASLTTFFKQKQIKRS